MIHSSEFPVRPQYQLGESLTSYVYRIHSENGHRIQSDFWKRYSLVRRHGFIIQRNVSATPGDLMEIIQDWLGRSCVLDKDWLKYGTPELIGRNGETNRACVCPDCLRQFGFHPAALELPFVTACYLHGTQLLDTCPDCHAQLKWTTMRPDWRCHCGHHLLSMHGPRAPSVQLQCSAMLAGAPDVVRPPTYPQNQLKNLGAEHYRLERVYRLLVRIDRVRAWILRSLRNTRSTCATDRYVRSTESAPSVWAIRLLSSWPGSFQSGLLRLARRYWRSSRATLVMIQPTEGLGEVIASLNEDGLSTGSWPNDPVLREAERLIDRYRVPVSTIGLALFNPRYSDEERQLRLTCFSVWWQSLIALRAGRCPELPTTLHVGLPTRNRDREVMAIELLSGLIDAANRGADPTRYAGVFHPLQGLRTGSVPQALLRQVFDALMALRYGELRAMRLTLHWIDDEVPMRWATAD